MLFFRLRLQTGAVPSTVQTILQLLPCEAKKRKTQSPVPPPFSPSPPSTSRPKVQLHEEHFDVTDVSQENQCPQLSSEDGEEVSEDHDDEGDDYDYDPNKSFMEYFDEDEDDEETFEESLLTDELL